MPTAVADVSWPQVHSSTVPFDNWISRKLFVVWRVVQCDSRDVRRYYSCLLTLRSQSVTGKCNLLAIRWSLYRARTPRCLLSFVSGCHEVNRIHSPPAVHVENQIWGITPIMAFAFLEDEAFTEVHWQNPSPPWNRRLFLQLMKPLFLTHFVQTASVMTPYCKVVT